MGLAHAVAAVEVPRRGPARRAHAGRVPPAPRQPPRRRPVGLDEVGREPLHRGQGRRLRGVDRVGHVRLEANAGKAVGWHQPGHELVGVELGEAVDEVRYSHSMVPGGFDVTS